MKQQEIWNKLSNPWSKNRQEKIPRIKKFLKGKKGKILDLGCGSGRNFYKIKYTKFYGVDFSKEMIKLAKVYAKENKISAELKTAEAYKTGFKDNFFDSAIFNAVLHCIDSKEKRKKSVEELFRVLKPNSYAVVSVWSRNYKKLKDKPQECKISWTFNGKKYERYTYIFSKKELEDLFKNAGFKIIKSTEDNNIVLIVKKPLNYKGSIS